WKALVKFVSPILIGFGLIQNVIAEFATIYGGYALAEVITFGWVAVVLVLIFAIYLGQKERTV
ncbi:MAG: sodium-dependent transporter, partial [Halanaerobium sp.]